MSIISEINRISGNISDSYTAVNNKGGTLPLNTNSDNLANAILSIPQTVSQLAITNPHVISGRLSGTESTVPASTFVETFLAFGQRGLETNNGIDNSDKTGFPQKVFKITNGTNAQNEYYEDVVAFQNSSDNGPYVTYSGQSTTSVGITIKLLRYNFATSTLTQRGATFAQLTYYGGQGEDGQYVSLENVCKISATTYVIFTGRRNDLSNGVANGGWGGYFLVQIDNATGGISLSQPTTKGYNKPEIATCACPCQLYPMNTGSELGWYYYVHMRARRPAVSVLQLNNDYTFTEIAHRDLLQFSGTSDGGSPERKNWLSSCRISNNEIYVSCNELQKILVYENLDGTNPIYQDEPRYRWVVSYQDGTWTVTKLYPLVERENHGTPDKTYYDWTDSGYGDIPISGDYRWCHCINAQLIMEAVNEEIYLHYYTTTGWHCFRWQVLSRYGSGTPQEVSLMSNGNYTRRYLIIPYLTINQKPDMLICNILNANATQYPTFNIATPMNLPPVSHPDSTKIYYYGYGYMFYDLENKSKKVIYLEGQGEVYTPYWANYTSIPRVMAYSSEYGSVYGVTKTDCPATGASGQVYVIPAPWQ